MTEIENIYNQFKEENPNLESVRKTSDKHLNISQSIIFTYVIIAFISIPFGNGYTIALFVGIIPLIIILHLLTKKRITFNQAFEEIQPKYLKLLSNILDKNISYHNNENTSIVEQSLFFNTKLKNFSTICNHQINIKDEKGNLSASNVDFINLNNKYSLVDFHWKKSLLICLDYKTGMTGKNLLIPDSYLNSHIDDDDGRQFSRVMPLKGHRLKLNFDKTSFFSGSILYSNIKREKLDLNSDAQLKIKNIYTNFFKGKEKFLSFTEHNIYVLIFKTNLFEPNVKKSIDEYNIFEDYKKEVLELEKMNRMMNTTTQSK